ncbi:DUF2470 domain-containing protein [Nocardiopsis sp. MG754419]|uniref:DUF2470 domain-containing protein n=1 Tax=Nocardiopsis sp. MG754419 TaxID=2259865 RepID=UPI001BABDFD7|nr:DUF2470 domain-containing protein [Nocardiopsis sp. MG754419]MBR8743846.1 DUF2470 domain-containing protein [Nocardiopsis sp. MG754419]
MIPLFTHALEPSPAERARSVLARPNPATVTTSDLSLHLTGPACHTGPDGEITLLVPDQHRVLAEIGPQGPEATIEFTDTAPVDLRDRTRSLLWINGALSRPTASEARERALAVLEEDLDERLLDLGHGRTMIVLHPHLVVYSDHDGCHLLPPEEFTRLNADPFDRWEGPWLRHLDQDHADLLDAVVAHCPVPLPDGRPRPLGVDRYGLRLRLEGAEGDHDVRIPFRRPARTAQEVAHQVQELAHVPYDRC